MPPGACTYRRPQVPRRILHHRRDLVGLTTAGPSQIVNGYSGDTLDDLFRELKEKFAGGGYSVAKDERDPQDAEVNFTSEKYDGQLRLGEECRGRRSVVITIRPRA